MLLDLARKPLYFSSDLATFEPSHRVIAQKQGFNSQRLLVESIFGRISQRTSLESFFCEISSCVIIYFALEGTLRAASVMGKRCPT